LNAGVTTGQRRSPVRAEGGAQRACAGRRRLEQTEEGREDPHRLHVRLDGARSPVAGVQGSSNDAAMGPIPPSLPPRFYQQSSQVVERCAIADFRSSDRRGAGQSTFEPEVGFEPTTCSLRVS
jgi:hypothetical protein